MSRKFLVEVKATSKIWLWVEAFDSSQAKEIAEDQVKEGYVFKPLRSEDTKDSYPVEDAKCIQMGVPIREGDLYV